MLKFLKKGRAALAFGLLALMTATAVAPDFAEARPRHGRGGWDFLGERQVADRHDRDVIRVRGRRRYDEIRLCVRRRAVRMHDFDVVFRNGGRQDIRVRRRLRAGQCTRAIQLRGRRARRIDRIILRYDSLRDRGRQPIVEIFGR